MALNNVAAVPQTTGLAGSSLEDFLQIMVKQLQYQDPLSPMDNQQFVAQMAQFASLQQTQAISSNTASLLSLQSSGQAIGLLGRSINAQAEQGVVSGLVSALDFTSGEPLLTVTTSTGSAVRGIRMGQIMNVLR